MSKKMWAFVAVLMASSACPGLCGAEGFLKAGAGVILKDTVPGGGISGGLTIPGSPVAVEGFADYFGKSGDSTAPVGVRILFQNPDASRKRRVYLGIGGGIGFSKHKQDAFITESRTNSLVSGTFGVLIRTAPRAGLFLEVLVHRLLTSNATTDIAGRVGITVRIGGK